jgi:voltage-gated sodium channel
MAQAGRRLPVAPGGVRFLAYLTESKLFQGFILACIIANALALGVDAQFGERNPWRGLIEQADFVFLMIFTGELALEFMAQGPRRYFASGWNWFDVIVVGLAFLATNPAISALRTLRVVRVFRLISAVPQMRRVVEALLTAMPGIIATLAVLALVFYIGAVMATTLFAGEAGFKDLGDSAITLFKVSQFDGWGDTIAQLQPRYPFAWAFILAFTVIGSFAVLNLFIGVIVDAVQNARGAADEAMQGEVHQVQENVHAMQSSQDDAALTQKRILDELAALRAEIAALREGKAATE